jgi:hypothetical protein
VEIRGSREVDYGQADMVKVVVLAYYHFVAILEHIRTCGVVDEYRVVVHAMKMIIPTR